MKYIILRLGNQNMGNKNIFKLFLSIILILSLTLGVCAIPTLASSEETINSNLALETSNETQVPNTIDSKKEYTYSQVYVSTPIKDEEQNYSEEVKDSNDGGLFSFAPAVDPLSGLKIDENAPHSIKLSWNPIAEISGYDVYYRQNGDDLFHFIYATASNEITISNLESCVVYDFMISPFVEVKDTKYEGTYQTISATTTPGTIGACSILTCGEVISFRWLGIKTCSGYEVQRNYYATDGYVDYKTIEDPLQTTFEDHDTEDGRGYFYRVRAYYNYDGNTYYSPYSEFKAVCGLYGPEVESITTQLSRFSISYDESPLAESYEIQYATNKIGPYNVLGDTTGLYFNSPRLTDGVHYFIRVVPYKFVGDTKVYGTYHTIDKVCSARAYAVAVGNTYIEVNLKSQHMWQYINGELVEECDVVTGNVGARATPKGCYKILQRQSPSTLVGEDYRTTVSYWLGFTYSGCGLHDATWRGSFGGSIYTYDGSHGCVNMPLNKVKSVYENARVGDYVVVY